MMVFEFYENGEVIRRHVRKKDIPNVVVGQRVAYEHPTMEMCLQGFITNISHTVMWTSPDDDENHMTSVDVVIDSRVPL